MKNLDRIINNFKTNKGSLIGLLQDISDLYGYLPEKVLEEVSSKLNVALSHFYSLATFYTSFRLEPMGKHHCSICVGTACHVRGATMVVESIERELNVKAGETTEDGNFTVETVNCLGACALGPLVVIDDDYHGNLDGRKAIKLLKKYED
ncbi:MAG: NAD(P)H-dependent oxidoreductase subunit E [Spirochaetota bacterium]|nr:MAG: NAD(P)H-dependent oxidoreductase subunit E [Spirochaetota bacterium]